MKKNIFIYVILTGIFILPTNLLANNSVDNYDIECITSGSAIELSATNEINIADGNCVISKNGDYHITGISNSNSIIVESGVAANITIKDINIVSDSPIVINEAAKVNLYLSGSSALKANEKSYNAGIFVANNAYLTIDGNGYLEVRGGYGSAGIGSNYCSSNYDPDFNPDDYIADHINKSKGNIEIKNGNITAYGGEKGVGIGGYANWSKYNNGVSADVNAITGKTIISGGNVTAYGGEYAAGIGGNYYAGTGDTIEINGGNITAYGGSGAVGIGTGYDGNNRNRCINGDIIINGGSIRAYGGGGASGIGVSYCSSNEYGINVEIYNGYVYAQGGNSGAGITLSGNITSDRESGWLEIAGGTVTAIGNKDVGIFNKNYDVWINAGSVKAIGINGENDISVRKYITNYNTKKTVSLKKFEAQDVESVTVDGADWKIADNHLDDSNIYLYLPDTASKVVIKSKGGEKTYNLSEKLGDINKDGEISTKDAVMALQMSTGKKPVDLIGDVNGDGSVTTKDATLILRYSTGKITKF